MEDTDIQWHPGFVTTMNYRELSDSVLNVSAQASQKLIQDLRKYNNMSQALLEIMEPLIAPLLLSSKEEGLKEGIQGTAKVLWDLGYRETEIRTIIAKQYNLSAEEAEEYAQSAEAEN